jgi:hypothetical protein
MGTWGSFPGIKWPGREAHHSLPYRAEVKNTPTAAWIFITWVLIKHRNSFTITFEGEDRKITVSQ